MADVEVSTHQQDGVWVVSVAGDIDVSNADRLREGLDRVLASGQERLVVDLRAVPFMDSTGLGVLVGRLKVVRARRGSMRLVCADPRMLRVLSITGLDTVFALHDTVESAIAALAAPRA